LLNQFIALLARSEIKRRTAAIPTTLASNRSAISLAMARQRSFGLIGRKATHDRRVGHSFLPMRINRQITIISSTDMHGAEMMKCE
jgi:hypothetical protein